MNAAEWRIVNARTELLAAVVAAHVMGGFTTSEIADVAGIDETTVAQWIERARGWTE